MSDKPAGEIIREFLSPHEFATLCGLALITVRRYLADGRLPAVQPGGRRCRVLIPRSALNLFTKVGDVAHAARRPSTDKPTAMPKRKSPAGPTPRWLADS